MTPVKGVLSLDACEHTSLERSLWLIAFLALMSQVPVGSGHSRFFMPPAAVTCSHGCVQGSPGDAT